jgi:hypothetical protein
VRVDLTEGGGRHSRNYVIRLRESSRLPDVVCSNAQYTPRGSLFRLVTLHRGHNPMSCDFTEPWAESAEV